MSERDFVVRQDRWPLARRPRFRLRSNRILPGPLKSLPRRGRSPAWMARLGIAGLSLATALAVAPQFRGAAPEPVPLVEAATEIPESAPVPPIVGAAPATAEPLAPAVPPIAMAPVPEEPRLRRTGTGSEPAPVAPPSTRRAATPAPELGPLPVLELDAAAFDLPAASEPAPRPTGRPAPRAAAPRLAGQP